MSQEDLIETSEGTSGVVDTGGDASSDESGESGKGGSGTGKNRVKRRGKRTVTDVVVHVNASFNNTVITVTDVKGNTLSWATAGGCGFRGSRKSTPFAGQVAAGKAVQKAKELYGAEFAEVRIYGPGPGRDASVRAVRDVLIVTGIFDVTGFPFNGCRAPKPRRV